MGVLFVDERQSGLTHEYFSAVLDSFKVEAEKRGYDITFINHNISGRSMTYLEHCHYRSVDGVVIACVNFYDPQVVELVNSDVPVVTIDMCSTTAWQSCRTTWQVSKLWSSRHGPADTGASLLSTAKRPRSLKTASPAFISL